MVASTNSTWLDTSVLPENILSLQGYEFFRAIERLVGEPVVELIRLQGIRNAGAYLFVEDPLAVLKLDSTEIDDVRDEVCHFLDDGSYRIQSGVEGSLRYLRELFKAKLNEHYREQQQRAGHGRCDASTSPEKTVAVGNKRSAEPADSSAKRRRK